MKAKAVYAQNILVVLGQTISFEHFHEARGFFMGVRFWTASFLSYYVSIPR